MRIELSPHETRVIGCLIEKQIATPEHYPLSLNALTAAVNQRSNRDPVLDLGETEVASVIDELRRRSLVSADSGFGSRVEKYRHRLCNTEYGTLRFTPQELALLCELMLRGAQTPGELRSRASRLASFADAEQVQQVLEALATREDGPFVRRLAREPGRREVRYAQLFSVTPEVMAEPAEADPMVIEAGLAARVAALETELQALRARIEHLENGAAAL